MDIKTPVSILQEYMIKNSGALPVYELEKISGPNHNLQFQYVVRAGSITSVGSGKSKQEAKHDAARNALKQLNEVDLLNTTSHSDENKTHVELETSLNNIFENTMESPVIITRKDYISLLQENIIKDGFVPVYNLLKITGENHYPLFEYVVRVNNVTAFGEGRTKQHAKHNAAKNMLIKLIKEKDGVESVENLQKLKFETTSDRVDTSSDSLNNPSISGTLTPVSILLNYCTQEDDLPEFKFTNSSGPQHNPTFEYTVKVKGLVVTGVGNTKKNAKQTAAKNALEKLKEKGLHPNLTIHDESGIFSYNEDETSDEETLPNLLDKLNISDNYENDVPDSEVIYKREELKGISNDTNTISIYEYHNLIKRLDPNIIENAIDLLHNNDEMDLQMKLGKVMLALEFNHTIEVLPCQESDSFGFTVKIKTNPIYVIAGIGKSIDEAKQNVIFNTFQFLEIMLK